MEGKPTGEIDLAVDKVTKTLMEAVEKHIPRIQCGTIPHPDPKIDERSTEDKNSAWQRNKLRENKRRLWRLREKLRERERDGERKMQPSGGTS